MKSTNLRKGIISLASLATLITTAPALASPESDAATRAAARMFAQQQGLPADYYDYQHAMQQADSNARKNKTSIFGNSNSSYVDPYYGSVYNNNGYYSPGVANPYYGNAYSNYGYNPYGSNYVNPYSPYNSYNNGLQYGSAPSGYWY